MVLKSQSFLAQLIISFILFVCGQSVHSLEVMTVRADTWCPFNCVPNSEKPGILVELMQYAFKDSYSIDYQTLPWPQSVADVRSGKFNSVIGAAGPDAVGMTHTERPQILSITCAYALESNKKTISKAKDLLRLSSIGTTKDYSYGTETDKALKDPKLKNKVKPIATDDALAVNFRRVLDGKIEAVIEDINVVSFQLKDRKISGIKNIGCTEDRVPLWIAFTETNPKAKAWTEKLDKAQAELEKSGKLAEIYKKYGVEPISLNAK